MSRFTPLALLVVVGVLGWFAYRQTEHEKANPLVTVGPLFEGVEARRLVAVRLENIRGSKHMRFERDNAGRWYLTDPIAWPAEQGLVDKILQVVRRNQADVVPPALVDEAAASFDPPRGFLETEELLENGEKRRVRIEVGTHDLDGVRIYVRRGGEVLRTARNIEALFEQSVDDYRDKRLFTVPPAGIASIERIGGWYDEGADEERLGMTAARFGDGWRIHKPVQVSGDPTIFGLWTNFLGALRARRFASDDPNVDREEYNLHRPWMTLRLTSGSGSTQSLHVSGDEGRIFAMRDDIPTVFELDPDHGVRLREAVENFYASAFAIVPRADVRRVWLKRDGELVRVSRGDGDDWTIARQPAGDPSFSLDVPADPARVADLLSAVENAAIVRYFSDVEVEDFFPADVQHDGLWIEPGDGVRRGGSFAPLVTTPQGTEVAPCLRDGESVVGSVDPAFAELARTPPEDLYDRSLWALENMRQRTLTIELGEKKRTFHRSIDHDWQPIDAAIPARELDPVLDHLLFLRAERHVPEAERPVLEGSIVVTFSGVGGEQSTAILGRAGEGDDVEIQVQVGPMRAVLAREALYEQLVEIASKDR